MKWLTRITWIYLALPFILFCMGWLRLSVAIPIVALMLWAVYQFSIQKFYNQTAFHFSRSTFYLLLITGFWVFLSGVGGYAFQNWDHHWRNAVLRDLITYNWPVIYSSPEQGPVKMLVYYVGYWLPSALVGKMLGWDAANFFLFLWTWLGVFLVVIHLCKGAVITPMRAIQYALLLLFFSGMDALGAILFAKGYPTLWPPVQHLEIWAGTLQYSSFTTQLFWVFNQAVPAWLCMALFVSLGKEKDGLRWQLPFVWSLCFFFAPLASIGLLPYLLIEFVKHTDFKSPFKNLRWDVLFAAVLIFLVSSLFFTSNTAAQERGLHPLALKDFLAFFLLDGGILWAGLAVVRWRDPRWMVTGVLLAIMPFIQLGSGRDFVMRASIVPLFYLMIMTGEVVFQSASPRILRFTLYALLFIGALTPLYEINRSVYRTTQYYLMTDHVPPPEVVSEPVTHLAQGVAPELEHPSTLTADEIKTLKFMSDKLSKNFIANVRQSLYYRYISSR